MVLEKVTKVKITTTDHERRLAGEMLDMLSDLDKETEGTGEFKERLNIAIDLISDFVGYEFYVEVVNDETAV